MKFVDLLTPRLIVSDLAARDKREVLNALAAHLAAHVAAIDRESLVRVLLERERLASTAIGEGVAIPHGKLAAVGKLIACIGRAPQGVDFGSMDGRPTNLFVLLVAPDDSNGTHLRALARISRLFKSTDVRTRLLQAKDAGDMYRVIADEDAKY
jgi:PTS system nitrogen regulatory IIA component